MSGDIEDKFLRGFGWGIGLAAGRAIGWLVGFVVLAIVGAVLMVGLQLLIEGGI
jgi:hypothetical protein